MHMLYKKVMFTYNEIVRILNKQWIVYDLGVTKQKLK